MKLTDKEIEEGCKLISEFQYPNWVHPKDNHENVDLSMSGDSYWIYAQLLTEDYVGLRYHSSWDSLMPVVDIILNEITMDYIRETPIWYAYYAIGHRIQDVNIEDTFKETVKFIKEYNKFK